MNWFPGVYSSSGSWKSPRHVYSVCSTIRTPPLSIFEQPSCTPLHSYNPTHRQTDRQTDKGKQHQRFVPTFAEQTESAVYWNTAGLVEIASGYRRSGFESSAFSQLALAMIGLAVLDMGAKRDFDTSFRTASMSSSNPLSAFDVAVMERIGANDAAGLETELGRRPAKWKAHRSLAPHSSVRLQQGPALLLLVLEELSPLLYAVVAGAPDCLRLLLQTPGIDPDACGRFAYLPLFWALKLGRVVEAEVLLRGGASLDAVLDKPQALVLALLPVIPPNVAPDCPMLHQSPENLPSLLRLLLRFGARPASLFQTDQLPHSVLLQLAVLAPDEPRLSRLYTLLFQAGYRMKLAYIGISYSNIKSLSKLF